MKKKVKLGLVGFGGRGTGLLKDILIPMTEMDIEICGVCDLYEDRARNAAAMVKEKCGKEPLCTLNYMDIVSMNDIDGVIIMSAWESHIPIAIAAMKAGKYVGMEVAGAYSIADCWDLVHTSEATGMPCMLLENCCYGRRELMVLNMVKKGVLGDIVHCSGGYCHDLRQEIAYGKENRHYRLRNYLNRNCENYPTHELGPIAEVLQINKGNRLLWLTSMASCSKGMHEYIIDKKGNDCSLANQTFAQGDIVTTTIKCAKGQTIVLTLDTTLPRAYSRRFTVRGTKGLYSDDNDSIFLDNIHNSYDFKWKENWGNVQQYEEEYLHPLWKNYVVQGGHDGMDWMVFRAFIESVKAHAPVPIDVYDAATWMSISALSEQSIATGSMPLAIPDFTGGRWMNRTDISESKYGLNTVYEGNDR